MSTPRGPRSLLRRPAVRWAVPAGLAALVLGGGVIAPALAAAPDLPDRTPEQLLADMQSADVEAWSGTVSYTADLGLPALPEGMGGEGGTDLMSLLSGTHTLRVWAAEPDRFRVALHGTFGESDLVADGAEVWAWSSEDKTATHVTLPDHESGEHPADDLPALSPDQVADLVLDALEPTTEVSTGPTTTVAGRAAYQLVLEPADEGSLVESIRVAVDGAELVPTRVQVFAVGSSSPALEIGFTDLSFAVPADDVFAFTPPAGAEVEELDLSDRSPRAFGGDDLDDLGSLDQMMPRPDVTVVGDGWASVLAASVPGLSPALLGGIGGQEAEAFLSALPEVSGDWGSGRLLTSNLFSVLLTDDGRVLAGAVDGAALQTAAAATAPRAD